MAAASPLGNVPHSTHRDSRGRPDHSRWPLLAALCTLLHGTQLAAAAPEGARYVCRTADGAPHLVAEDLAQRFRLLLADCQPQAPQALPATAAAAARPGMATGTALPDIFIIQRSSNALSERSGKPYRETGLPELPAGLVQPVHAAASRHGLDVRLLQAVIQVESGYHLRARSPKGALGLMQLMPATAARLGAAPSQDLFEPALNIELGARYLRLLGDLFDGRLDLVLAAYNAGEGAVQRHGLRVPPYPETEAYVRKIIGLLSAGAG